MTDYKIRYIVSAIVLLALAIPVSAITIDAQAETVCNWGNCETKVNLTKYLTALEIGSLKLTDLSSSKPKLTANLETFNYRYEKSFIIFYGKVKADVYWTFDLKNGYIIDPYWNYTEEGTEDTVSIGVDSLGDANNNDFQGNVITAKADVMLVSITKHGSDESTNATITFMNNTYISNASFSGNTATFSPYVNLTDGESYHVYTYGNANRAVYIVNPVSYPITTGRDINVITGQYYNAGWNNDSLGRSVDNITTLTHNISHSVWYTTNLYLNGNESNITLDNATQLNATGITNLTGLNVSLYRNGSFLNSGLTNATNLSYLSAGLYNITARIGNSTTNFTNITYWATITFTEEVQVGYIYCTDNETLAHINITNLETDNVITYYDHCVYGCDNITHACFPEPYIQDLYTFLVLCGFVVLAYIIYRGLK